MTETSQNLAQTTPKQQKNQSFLTGSLELIPGFEPGTSSLPKAHIKALNAFERSEFDEQLSKRKGSNVRERVHFDEDAFYWPL